MHQQHQKLHFIPLKACDIKQIEADLKHRLTIVLASKTNGTISKDTGFNPETIRRYRRTGRMPASFLIAVSQAYSIDAHWLFSGEDLKNESIRANTIPKILSDIADELPKTYTDKASNNTTTVLRFSAPI